MRRALSLILIGLGVFCIAGGLLLRFYAYGQLAKIPQDPDTTSTAQGTGVTALVYVPQPSGPAKPEIRQNLSLTSTTKVTGDLRAPESKKNGDTVTWIEASMVTEDQGKLVVNGSVRTLCLDRFTGEAVAPCTNGYLEKEKGKKITASGSVAQFPGYNFKLPFGTEKETYKWYDSTLEKPADARFDGEEQINGVDVYRFRQKIPVSQVATRQVPGSLIGRPETPTVDAGLFYEVDRTLWIEPVTGAMIKLRQWSKQELRTADQGPGQGTTVFDGTMELNPESVANNVNKANENISKLWLLTGLPVILYIVGAVALIAGIVLLLTGRSRSRHTF
ncbi:DUF3068 domain-containing protein [Kibdelosporangium philippinense]|uniref:DUF3068 domain-containing protein n=1 Tax=Kibdelosporangium philippinense TaxID=211113 RepID=A0ABS8ZSQ2_9PSEU|nr:DUF3068 domain-containing protein [Kibdelosporangium philippinense]MCE7010731.1 DUF3068 domain-containing protein [Kibdelosporangium philippinense]